MKKIGQSIVAIMCIAISFNSFSQTRSLGMKVDRKKAEAIPLVEKPLGFGDNLPKSYSLKKYVPNIGDQGDHGTCVGWSSTYYLASMEYAIHRNITKPIELKYSSYDPYYTYLSIVDKSSYSSCEDGTFLEDACKHLSKNGAKRKINNELSCGDDLSKFNDDQSILDFTDFVRVYDWLDDMEENVTAVCQSIVDKHPVVFGIYVPASFFDIGNDGLFKPTNYEREHPVSTAEGGHAMTIVGYDDEKFGGCFTVVNSWGEDWGDDGFLYMKYDDFQAFGQNAYSFDTKLKERYTQTVGTVFGETYSGYGINRYKGGGLFEGEFRNGQMDEGVYFNHSKKLFKGGKLFMKKMVKKNYGYLIYDKWDAKKPIGFVLK